MKKLIIILTAILLICSCTSTPREESFTVDLKSPRQAAGSAEAYLKKILSFNSNLTANDIDVYYYPMEDAVCLHFKVQFVDCNQFWDKAGRDAFVTAFERYKEEYGQHQLIVKKNKKTRAMYGAINGYFVWKKTPVSAQAHGSPKIKLGYQFNGKSAFFTATQMEAYFEDPIGKSRDQTSAVTVLYFTRSQAESLAELFKQDYLDSLRLPGGTGGSDTGVDEYEEWE